MTPQDRALKKQLLVMKGEALRVKLKLEKQKLLEPLRWAGEGFALWRAPGQLGAALDILGKLLPNEKLGRWLKGGGRLLAAWRLFGRWLKR
ncbi:hypothetical protein KIF53_04670 [Chromobacterium subtsugae]|uniref:YqjK-like protein n=1 Tax=Chromobacterium subtsugae TaxID=251747 RepID=A0ABS7FA04_9NEIS|nr:MULTISPECIES: hypothetical protein [Chromobacterium]KUM02063.1 hypothetical protein Cv017_05140 [Chromobacterium subtsugae]KZE87026.1 hypothetical protein AWB61_11745 [Chromobacterium sp. F49]MBW7566043.1 hypothetical protein [Chromobacterium subtsugae]MBW8286917.1 hypothetical protein [Chromobacterium subtsugae]OBU88297.1 hypothetical protein MY55_01930 [Chromobacterium subtsugae]